jgi:hypothetical protein
MHILKKKKSKRGCKVGHCNGYIYNFTDKICEATFKLCCIDRKCKALLFTNSYDEILSYTDHYHDPDFQKSNIMNAVDKNKQNALEKNVTSITAYTEQTSTMDSEVFYCYRNIPH